MKHCKNIFVLSIIGFIFIGCNNNTTEEDNYPRNPKWSKLNNEPLDSMTFYFPFTIKKDSSILNTNLDSFNCKWYSMALYEAGEKILFNSYEGHDIYRFLWLRAFNPPIIFSLNKNGDRIWLKTKSLDKQPPVAKMVKTIKFEGPNGEVDTTNHDKEDSIMMANANRKAEISSVDSLNVSIIEWEKFEKLLSHCNFWKMTPFIESWGIDGSNWIIEAHLKNKYWVVDRWSPKDDYRKCGEYLIELSKLKEEIY